MEWLYLPYRAMFRLPILFALVLGMCFGIPKLAPSQSLIESTPLGDATTSQEEAPLFQRLDPEESGVRLTIPVIDDHPLARVYTSSSACSGVAIGDVDLDGKPDIFAGNGPGQNALYLQREALQFEDVAETTGVAGTDATWAAGSALVDIDNDGDLDIYICNYDYPNQLFINLTIDEGQRTDGPLKFEERASEFGLDVADGCVVPAFADYDRDGDLDLYILMHQIYRAEGRPPHMIPLEAVGDGTDRVEVAKDWMRWYRVAENQVGENGEIVCVEAGRPDMLLRNDGEAGFTEVTVEAGINNGPHWGNSATWWDYNGDTWPDLYVGNDFESPDYLYRNNGDGTFTEVAEQSVRVTTWFSMGAVQSDFNNDGHVDFLGGDMLPKSHYMKMASTANMADRLDNMEYAGGPRQTMHNVLHINTGTDQFLEGAWMAGVPASDWTWAIRSADFDNDMRPDLFFCNGVPRHFNFTDLPTITHGDLIGHTHWDYFRHFPERPEQNLAYRNVGEFQFKDVSKDWGLDHVGMSYGASLGDLDGDGRMDLLTSNLKEPLSVYWNRGDAGNRVLLDLRGTQSNSMGVGCIVTAETPDGVVQTRQLFPYGGFLDADQCVVHFGLQDNDQIRTLRIAWPSGQTQEFKDLAANHRYRITEPDEPAAKPPAIKTRKTGNTWFVESDATEAIQHEEIEFDDYQLQPLLPYKLSQLGPGQAWSDLDGDGDDDFFLAGAAGQSGQLYLNDTDSDSLDVILTPLPSDTLAADAEWEDMGAVFLDVDSDGDQDLYVVSGGSDRPEGDTLLKDRLYLNSGSGKLVPAADSALPDLGFNGSVVAPADFDRDGDLDLFVGSRSVPGTYPISPQSQLLRNDGGTFSIVDLPFLQEAGMVTGALWSDANNDGWLDLFLTTEWGPIQFLLNQEGTLQPLTEEVGLDGEFVAGRGWWNGIASGDIDGDGDLDYVATNLGRNTQYQASLKLPELIFYGDFDDSGKRHIVEGRFVEENGQVYLFPRRGFRAAMDAMPKLGDRMQTFHGYGSATLQGIYGFDKLQEAQSFRANRMDSAVLINDGKAHFEIMSLPQLAQVSPSFGVVLADLNLDGHLDAYLVQNLYEMPEELGPLASGLSLLLRGTGDPKEPFEPVLSGESGLEVPGDAKSLAVIDINQDGRQDFMVGVNDANPQLFLNRTVGQNDTHPLKVRLRGKPGNLTGIGSKVRLTIDGFPNQLREQSGGGSYLTQSSADLVFAVPNSASSSLDLEVQWPDGTRQTVQVDYKQDFVTIQSE